MWGKRPYEIFYPNLKCPVAQYTFDDLVFEYGWEKAMKRDMQIYGMGGLKGVM